MADFRISLLDCHQETLVLGNDIYRLDTIAGRGGSCLVYYGWREEEGGVSQRVVIKEFYPLEVDIKRDFTQGTLLMDGESPEICAQKERFLKSYEIFVSLTNAQSLNQFVVKAQRKYCDHGTCYLVINFASGTTLEDRIRTGLNLTDFCGYLITLSKVINRLHQKEFVHLDLKPANILCEENAVTELLDVDSIVSLAQLRSGCALPCSTGFTAPELYRYAARGYFSNEGFSLQRSVAVENIHRADIYSFGAIIYYWLFSSLVPTDFEESELDKEAMLRSLSKKTTNLPEKSIRELSFLLRKLLKKTLSADVRKRYSSMEAVRADLEQIQYSTVIQIQDNFMPNANQILGREEKLTCLEALLAGQSSGTVSRIVMLCGVGGVGKSALARQFAKQHREDYVVIAEVYASSAEEAISRIEIRNWEPDSTLNAKERFHQCKKKITELSYQFPTLVIVHDYDVSEDPHFSAWGELGCDILITSRHQWDTEETGIPVLSLKCEDLTMRQAKDIFAAFYTQRAKTDEQRARLNETLKNEDEDLTKLLLSIDLLPLGIKFQARHMSLVPGQELLPSQALRVLEETGFTKTAPERFQNRNDCYVHQGNIYEHVKAILRQDLERVLSSAHQEALRFMTLVPSSCGISKARFEAWTGLAQTCLTRLEEMGWLEFLPSQKDQLLESSFLGVYVLPTVFQQVLRQESQMESTPRNSGSFLRQCSIDTYNGPFPARMAYYTQQDFLVKNLTQDSSRAYIRFLQNRVSLQRLADVSWDKHFTEGALNTWHICLEMCQKYHPDDFDLSASCYRLLSIGYHSIGMGDKALYYYSALNQKQNFSEDQEIFSGEKLNDIEGLSNFFLEQGLAERAISLLQQCLEDQKAVPGINPARRALWLRSIGTCYRFQGNWILSWKFMTEAYWEISSIFDPNSINAVSALTIVYRELGLLACEMGDLQAARKYLHNALRGYIQIFGESHPNTCDVLGDIAKICVMENEVAIALTYHKKAMEACLNSGVPLEKGIIAVLEVALDYLSIPGYEAKGEHALQIAYKTLNQNQNAISVACFADAVTVMKDRYAQHFSEHQVRTGLTKLEELCFLCRRFFGKSQALAKEYRSLAEMFSRYDISLKSSHYQQLARQCEK